MRRVPWPVVLIFSAVAFVGVWTSSRWWMIVGLLGLAAAAPVAAVLASDWRPVKWLAARLHRRP